VISARTPAFVHFIHAGITILELLQCQTNRLGRWSSRAGGRVIASPPASAFGVDQEQREG
jgi:hypothetical protein